jgi:hypothetical protein
MISHPHKKSTVFRRQRRWSFEGNSRAKGGGEEEEAAEEAEDCENEKDVEEEKEEDMIMMVLKKKMFFLLNTVLLLRVEKVSYNFMNSYTQNFGPNMWNKWAAWRT